VNTVNPAVESFSIIPLARIVRTHGFPKLGVCIFKADLFHHDASLFKGRKKIFISLDSQELSFRPSEIQWQEVEVAAPISPQAGSFSNAKGILIPLKFPEDSLRNFLVGMPREAFPPLQNSFYIHDVLGMNIFDENQNLIGSIRGFEDNGVGTLRSVNFVIDRAGAKSFSVPVAWFSNSDIQNAISDRDFKICAEGIEQWFLDSPIPNDEN